MNNISCVRKNDSLFSLSVTVTYTYLLHIIIHKYNMYHFPVLYVYVYHFRTESGLLYFVMQPARFLRVFNY